MAVLVGATACDKESPPTPIAPTVEKVPSTPLVPLTRVRLSGPSSLAPGTSAPFTATGTYADGTTGDLTSTAAWSSSDDAVLAVTDAGVATARSNGTVSLKVSFASLSDSQSVVVVPAGLFKLSAFVTDDVLGAPIYGARLEITDGAASGLATTASWDGVAALYGVPEGEVHVRVTGNGYLPVDRTVRISGHTGIGVRLTASNDSAVLRGPYRLSISAAACDSGSPFPHEAKSRTYDALAWNNGLRYSVELSGARFVPQPCRLCGGMRGDRFFGDAIASNAQFTLHEYEYIDWNAAIYPDIVERLPDGRLLAISGRAAVMPSEDGFAGVLDGLFAIFNEFNMFDRASVPVATCRSSSIRIVFAR